MYITRHDTNIHKYVVVFIYNGGNCALPRQYHLVDLMQMYRKPGCVIILSQPSLIQALHDFCTSYNVYAIAI